MAAVRGAGSAASGGVRGPERPTGSVSGHAAGMLWATRRLAQQFAAHRAASRQGRRRRRHDEERDADKPAPLPGPSLGAARAGPRSSASHFSSNPEPPEAQAAGSYIGTSARWLGGQRGPSHGPGRSVRRGRPGRPATMTRGRDSAKAARTQACDGRRASRQPDTLKMAPSHGPDTLKMARACKCSARHCTVSHGVRRTTEPEAATGAGPGRGPSRGCRRTVTVRRLLRRRV